MKTWRKNGNKILCMTVLALIGLILGPQNGLAESVKKKIVQSKSAVGFIAKDQLLIDAAPLCQYDLRHLPLGN